MSVVLRKGLWVSAQPQDSEIGCGGTLARLTEEGTECHVAVLGGPPHQTSLLQPEIGFERRRAEQELAAKKLKIKHVHWLDIGPMDQLELMPVSKAVQGLDKLLAAEQFDAVFCPLPGDPAHRYTWTAVMASGRGHSRSVYAYEQPRCLYQPTGLASRFYYKLEQKHLDVKEQALLCHRSQLTGRVHSLVGVAGIMVLAELRGLECGSEFAELFHVLRMVL